MTNALIDQSPTANALLLDFLAWVEREPRAYTEAMEAWRSSCPRFTTWEDALSAGLIQIDRRNRVVAGRAQVTLTERGAALLCAPRLSPRGGLLRRPEG